MPLLQLVPVGGTTQAAAGEKPAAAPAPEGAAALFPRATKAEPLASDRKMIYEGSPSWKAYLGYYVIAGFVAFLLIAILQLARTEAPLSEKFLEIIVPLAAATAFGFGIMFYRKSIKFRVTNTVIEFERGLLSKRIDVLQLWRVRDVVYKQNLVDRILGIAHVEIVAQDTTNPDLEIVGMPASRQLFEQIRDSIEIQRQAKNVVGVVS